jgi:hypothetical protein
MHSLATSDVEYKATAFDGCKNFGGVTLWVGKNYSITRGAVDHWVHCVSCDQLSERTLARTAWFPPGR